MPCCSCIKPTLQHLNNWYLPVIGKSMWPSLWCLNGIHPCKCKPGKLTFADGARVCPSNLLRLVRQSAFPLTPVIHRQVAVHMRVKLCSRVSRSDLAHRLQGHLHHLWMPQTTWTPDGLVSSSSNPRGLAVAVFSKGCAIACANALPF